MKYIFHVQLQNSLKEVKVNQFPKTLKEIKNTKREFFFMSMKKTNTCMSIPFMLDVC